jgi:hypothetical protein
MCAGRPASSASEMTDCCPAGPRSRALGPADSYAPRRDGHAYGHAGAAGGAPR